jgi:perosamine synthetase
MSAKESKLALHGGAPVRKSLLPYGRQWLDDDDVASVAAVLRSDWLTTGPKVAELEASFARATGAAHAVALASGTAALHAAVHALGIGAGDEVIVPAITFAASANCVLYEGATPVFADVDPDTLLIDPRSIEERVGPRTRAILTVDYAGQPCDYGAVGTLARRHGLAIIADACHSLGAADAGRPAGSLADLSAFSLHPVKAVTSGEGGIVTTDQAHLAQRMRVFRNHGIETDHRQRLDAGSFAYEMVELGYNYRLSDIQCALAASQLEKLGRFIERRRAIAARYDEAFASLAGIRPLATRPGATHAYHLYVVRLDPERRAADRQTVYRALRAEGIGVNVHYLPVHLHPYYRQRFSTGPGLCPIAEAAWERILSLPIFPRMTDADVDDVVTAVHKVAEGLMA